jgi:CRISPR/Cas system CSM-associated protein Csm2 small subunit
MSEENIINQILYECRMQGVVTQDELDREKKSFEKLSQTLDEINEKIRLEKLNNDFHP